MTEHEMRMFLFEQILALRQLLIVKNIITQDEWDDALEQTKTYLKELQK